MNDSSTNNFHAIVKQVNKFDGKRAGDFLEWQSKLRTALSLYNRKIYNVLQGEQRPSNEDPDGATARVTWDIANQNLFGVLFFATTGSAFSVVRRFEGKRPQDGPGHGQQAWAALCEKFDGCSREALRAEHYKMNHTKMTPGQDPDEFLYIMDSRRDRLNTSTPPEGPTDRQYEDILLQALSPDYESIRRAHLERRDFGLADIRRMMAAIYADNLSRRSITTTGIAGPGVAMKTMDRDLSDVQCHNCSTFGHYRRNCPNRRKQQYKGGQNQQQPFRQQHTRGRQQKKGGGGGIWCSYYKTTTHSDADCRVQHKEGNGNVNVAAVQPSRVGMCSALDLPEQDNEPERPSIVFSATEVTSKAVSTQTEKDTWPFGPQPTMCPVPRHWTFVERSRPTTSLGEQDKPDGTHIHRRENEDEVPIYGTARMALESPGVEWKPHGCGKQVTVVVDSGASGNYFDDQLIPELKHRLVDRVDLSVPRKILTAGGSLLEGTSEGLLQGLVTDEYGNSHLVRVDILIVSGIGSNLYSVKAAASKGIASIFDIENPRLEGHGITIPLRIGDNNLYSFVLDLSADGYGATELAMNAVANAELWHRRLGHLNKRTLDFMQRRDGNGITFDGTLADCDVCAVGKSHQLAHPKKAENADIKAPFQLVYADLMGPFAPAAHGGYKYVSKITDHFSRWNAVYLLCSKDQALASLQAYVTSTVIPFSSRIVRFRADKGGEYTGKDFQAYCLETGIKQEFAATNTPQQIGVSERVGRTLCAMVRCLLVDSGLPPNLWGELMLTTTYLCNRVPHSALKMETPYKVLYGKKADLSHLKIIGSRAFVHIKDSTKLGHTSWEGMVCGFSENESNSYRVWNPMTRRVVEARNVVFIETPPHLIPQPSQPSPLHRLQSSSLKFTEDTLDDNYVSNEEMLQDVRDYTAALDFNIDILADRDDLHGESSRGGVSPGNGLSGGDTPEAIIPSSSPAPSLAPVPTSAPATAASKVTTRPTSRYVQHSGVTPAVTRSQASRQNQTHAETRNQRNSNNTFVAIAKLFGSDTLSHLCKLGPFSTEALDIAHQMYYRGTLSAEYAYAATNLQESCLRGGEKERIPNTFKEAMSLPKAAYWKEAADKEIQSLEKHGVYELVPMSFVPSSQKVVGTPWVNKIKVDGTFKSRLVVQGWSQVPGIDYGGTFAPT